MNKFTVLLILATVAVCSGVRAADPVEFEVGGFAFQRPPHWNWVQPASAMRKAELLVPGPSGAAEVTFFHFGPGEGGSVAANLSRWLTQFQEPVDQLEAKTAEQMAGSTKVHFVQARGTFLSGMPGGPTEPRPGHALRGAILENSKDGDVYVKMTGPADILDAAATAFDTMVLDAAAAREQPERRLRP